MGILSSRDVRQQSNGCKLQCIRACRFLGVLLAALTVLIYPRFPGRDHDWKPYCVDADGGRRCVCVVVAESSSGVEWCTSCRDGAARGGIHFLDDCPISVGCFVCG